MSWVGWAWFFSLVFLLLHLFLPHSLIGLQSLCFLPYAFSFGIPSHASLGDKDAGPAFSREHGHLGTMGEQCCALNSLPRFVNKNE